MSSIASRHTACLAQLTMCLSHLQDWGLIWVRNPMRLGTTDAPHVLRRGGERC